MFDYMIVTHIPAFYKVNLYNEIAKRLSLYVVFICDATTEKRSSDFTVLDKAIFPFEVINHSALQNRSKFLSIYRLAKIVGKVPHKEVLICGWDLMEFWFLIFISAPSKNCLVLESTIIESKTVGVKGRIKKLFLSRIAKVFASGKLHVKLLDELNFNREVRVTKGVGIINMPEYDRKKRAFQKRFLFVGRLTTVKNMEFLVRVFNKLPSCKLTVIGCGEEKQKLLEISKSNVVFHDSIDNKLLKEFFLEHDIFILPSLSEPWGLVVEEAIYFGLPVIASSHCGAGELIENGRTGYIFNPYDESELFQIIKSIDRDIYECLAASVAALSIEDKDSKQVMAYAFK